MTAKLRSNIVRLMARSSDSALSSSDAPNGSAFSAAFTLAMRSPPSSLPCPSPSLASQMAVLLISMSPVMAR
ncbi:hypothetical protein D9M71_803080 [compost metagenome]